MQRSVTGSAARTALAAAALLASSAPTAIHAQPAQAPQPAAAEAPAPVPQRQGLSESVAAVVNDEIVSTYDLTQRMLLLIVTSGVQPTEQNLAQFQREALISLVDEHLQLQELRHQEKQQKFQIIADDQEVDEEVKGLAQQNNMTQQQFMGYLASRGIGPDTLRQQMRASISWSKWIRGRYGSRLRIGADQITAAQAKLAADAAKPQYAISEVLIDPNRAGGMSQAVNGAQQLISQIRQGAPFPAVARQFSVLPTAANGGDAGWVAAGEMSPEVEQAVAAMRPGQLSEPIQTKDGVYIIYLRDKRSGGAVQLVNLKQVAIALPQGASPADETAARDKLLALKPKIKDCATLEATAGQEPGVVAGDLGEAEPSDLAPAFRQAAETLKVGEVSEPLRTNVGLHLIAVCGRRSASEAVTDKDQVEQRLFSEQLSLIARRYMRDLRNSATIETR